MSINLEENFKEFLEECSYCGLVLNEGEKFVSVEEFESMIKSGEIKSIEEIDSDTYMGLGIDKNWIIEAL